MSEFTTPVRRRLVVTVIAIVGIGVAGHVVVWKPLAARVGMGEANVAGGVPVRSGQPLLGRDVVALGERAEADVQSEGCDNSWDRAHWCLLL
jgi:hypothetical protein